MQRSLWQGAVSFGLIHVPVVMYSASRDGALGLHLLDRRDFAPVGYQRVNKSTGKEVTWTDIVKGYEYEKGQYVALSDADFKHANVEATQTIDIATFAHAADIDPMLYQMPYYLAPGKGGEKVYALLRDALDASSKVAVATMVMRGRQHLCVVMARERALLLITLRFEDEILPPDALKAQMKGSRGPRIQPAELSMARKLIDEMSGAFRPGDFQDTYRADLMRRIREKIRKGQTHTLAEEPKEQGTRHSAEVIDLVKALKDSLKSGRKERRRA